jgi:glycosyltransferase involved in cell wall biosynthesis
MLSILISAYACSPNMGSEPGMAWNWCVNLAKYCELYIITEGEFRDNIENVIPTLPQGKNMHFYYNPVSDRIRKMCWNQGDWRFYYYYKKWQRSAYTIVKDILNSYHIDVIHQLNMIGFREPGYLWKIDKIPFIWGPVDAKDKYPIAYLKGLKFRQKVFVRLKNSITVMQLKHSKRVKISADKAMAVLAASSDAQCCFKKYMNIDTILINETGCNQIDFIEGKANHHCFDLLWVGKMDIRKQLSLAINTIKELNNDQIRLHIIGGGEQKQYKELSEKLDVKDQCVWHGSLPHDEVMKIMTKSDLLFFTSVAEGTPHVVLEAISNGLPVVCFDTCGQGDVVNDKVGVKIPLTDPIQSATDFAKAINRLYENREELKIMSENCFARANELSWDNKIRSVIDIYNKVCKS